jgi:hypothetical protein
MHLNDDDKYFFFFFLCDITQHYFEILCFIVISLFNFNFISEMFEKKYHNKKLFLSKKTYKNIY